MPLFRIFGVYSVDVIPMEESISSAKQLTPGMKVVRDVFNKEGLLLIAKKYPFDIQFDQSSAQSRNTQ